MRIQHEFNKDKGSFYLELNGQAMAQLTITMASNDKMIIDHTEVDDSLKGEGVGHKLVEASVDYARKNQLKIKPLCPFAKAVFDKKEQYGDVLWSQ